MTGTTSRKSNKEEYEDLSHMPLLEDDKQVKREKRLKILTPKKLLTKHSILLAQVKAGSNSYKLKIKIRQILYFLYQLGKITKKVCNSFIKSS